MEHEHIRPLAKYVKFWKRLDYVHDSSTDQNLIYYLYLHFFINIEYMEIIYNSENKTVLYLICNHTNGIVGV